MEKNVNQLSMVFQRSHKKFVFIHKGWIMIVIFHCFIPYEDALIDLQQIATLCKNGSIFPKTKILSNMVMFNYWYCQNNQTMGT
jgi:hypothetical protein